MMGLCKSCFSSKYYGSSPEDTDPHPDAEMLLSDRSGGSTRASLITAGPEPEKIIDEAAVLLTNTDKLERCETDDSGTCVDEENKVRSDSREEVNETEHEKDLVQLTVSSAASLAGDSEQETITTQLSVSSGLPQIPESGANNQQESPTSDRKESFSGILKPASKTRQTPPGRPAEAPLPYVGRPAGPAGRDVVNFWIGWPTSVVLSSCQIGWPKSSVLSSALGPDCPKVQYRRQLFVRMVPTDVWEE